MNQLKSKDIIRTIEEYRKAFWAHRDLQLMKEKRYSPVVGWEHITKFGQQPIYQVWLYDTWISMPRKGTFSQLKEEVPNSRCSANSLDMALQELLNVCRVQFMDDKLFNRIKTLEVRLSR